jgi:hypothetical protein
VIAENQDASPWEHYHVSQGFKPTDSCVTIDVVYGHTYGLGSPNVYGGGAVALVSPEMILNQILAEIARDRRGPGYQRHMIVLNPEVAQELHSRLGYSRESLIQYLYEKSGIPFESLQPAEIASIQKAIDSGSIPKDRVPVFQAGLKPGGKVPAMLQPGDLHIIVAGGIPGYTLTLSGYQRGLFKPLAHNTKLVRSTKPAE